MDKQQKIDALFAKAKLTPTAIPFSESKDLFTKSVEAGTASPNGKVQFFNLKNILIMIGILGALSFLISVSITGPKTSEVKSSTTEIQQKTPTVNDPVGKIESPLNEKTATLRSDENELWMDLIRPLPIREIYLKRELVMFDNIHSNLLMKPVSKNDDQIQFPKLTEKEIAANHKQKRKMIKALSKFNRKKYAYIPSGSYFHEKVPVSVQSFYIQRAEVTNLEYRTFLFDLLIQGRKNDFLMAAPDQTLWTKALDDSLMFLQENYFSNSLFNNFPVVNVSKKGVEMYCKWITIETNKVKKSDFINDVRIPLLFEWTYAASNLGQQSIYPWEGKLLTTDDMFNANFKLSEYTGDLDLMKQRTKTGLTSRTTFEHYVGLMMAWVRVYEPTELGLYDISGNVAEMVSMDMLPNSIQIEKPTANQIVTCGGSWMSSIDDLKIYNQRISDDINGHPSIGFRVVVTSFQITD